MIQRFFRIFLLILLVSLLFADCYAYFSIREDSATDAAGAQEAGATYLSDAIIGESGSEEDTYSEISTFRPNRTNMVLFLVVIVAISAIVEAKSGFVRKKVRKNR